MPHDPGANAVLLAVVADLGLLGPAAPAWTGAAEGQFCSLAGFFIVASPQDERIATRGCGHENGSYVSIFCS